MLFKFADQKLLMKFTSKTRQIFVGIESTVFADDAKRLWITVMLIRLQTFLLHVCYSASPFTTIKLLTTLGSASYD